MAARTRSRAAHFRGEDDDDEPLYNTIPLSSAKVVPTKPADVPTSKKASPSPSYDSPPFVPPHLTNVIINDQYHGKAASNETAPPLPEVKSLDETSLKAPEPADEDSDLESEEGEVSEEEEVVTVDVGSGSSKRKRIISAKEDADQPPAKEAKESEEKEEHTALCKNCHCKECEKRRKTNETRKVRKLQKDDPNYVPPKRIRGSDDQQRVAEIITMPHDAIALMVASPWTSSDDDATLQKRAMLMALAKECRRLDLTPGKDQSMWKSVRNKFARYYKELQEGKTLNQIKGFSKKTPLEMIRDIDPLEKRVASWSRFINDAVWTKPVPPYKNGTRAKKGEKKEVTKDEYHAPSVSGNVNDVLGKKSDVSAGDVDMK
jgi:hypothetical protein